MDTARDTRRPATVLHTADCHLGTAAHGREEVAFERAMALANAAQVDAVLIVGDLFDNARISDDVLDWTAAQLDSLSCPVVVIPGNHDVLDAASIHHRFDMSARCGHVDLIVDLDGRTAEIPGTDVIVWGRAMAEHQPEYRPFAGLPARPSDRWSIAAGHGLVMDGGPSYRSSPIFAGDLAAIDWDYVALGHVHAYSEIRDEPSPVRYPGATAGSRDGAPGVVLVDFIPGVGAHPRWVGLAG